MIFKFICTKASFWIMYYAIVAFEEDISAMHEESRNNVENNVNAIKPFLTLSHHKQAQSLQAATLTEIMTTTNTTMVTLLPSYSNNTRECPMQVVVLIENDIHTYYGWF